MRPVALCRRRPRNVAAYGSVAARYSCGGQASAFADVAGATLQYLRNRFLRPARRNRDMRARAWRSNGLSPRRQQ